MMARRHASSVKLFVASVGGHGATFDPSIGFIAGQLTMGPDKNAYFKK
ncbi:hypothetical protein GA0116948_109102 [Chitinophaga costaii]|uniref:Uncharacterized protein n=1 Tax=Chitinophaga costaii TaxID=1335309 RepID=A0A1C4EPS1_9BACT|nr:hypothetical protein [Chitinophaga costaii]SCC45625.1 hypothetical protein GA0116948_109102 [Chitinophaga costaii]